MTGTFRSLINSLLPRFKGTSKMVLARIFVLMLASASLNGLGAGMILPLLQTIIDGDHTNSLVVLYLPFLAHLTHSDTIIVLCLTIIALFLLKAYVTYLYVKSTYEFAEAKRAVWIEKIGRNYILGSLSKLHGFRQGELLNNWQNETSSASRYYVFYFSFMSKLLEVLALIAVGFFVSWSIMLAGIFVGALVFLALRHVVFGHAEDLGRKKLEVYQNMTAQMSENLTNLRDIKLVGAEKMRLASLKGIAETLKRTFVAIAIHGQLPRIVTEFVAIFGMMIFVIISIAFLRQPPEMIVPTLAFFLFVMYRLISAVSQLVSARIRYLNEINSLRLVEHLSDEVSEDDLSGSPVTDLSGSIRFEHVDFYYVPDEPVLADANLVFQPGKLSVLLGASGSGKSTILDLLTRITNPTGGRIVMEDEPIHVFNLTDWRRMIRLVSQDTSLLNGTIRSNLLLGKHDATQAEMDHCCKLSGAEAVVASMENGFDTKVGDRGVTLSGGQKKRLAIARALLSRPKILVLDEATTAFEAKLELRIIADIRAAFPGITIILVTHRLETAPAADHVILLDRGHVICEGPWREVMNTCGDLELSSFSQGEAHVSEK